MTLSIPRTEPVQVAPDTFLIHNVVAAEPGTVLPVNSVLIRGEQPVIVDTGAPVHRAAWLDQVFNLVAPEDVRWIFLSHDDGDHTGALRDVLALCPQATLVTNFFATERLALEWEMPLERMIWLEPGQSFDAGDRTLRMVLPPIFDGPATRGLMDEKSGIMWAVDSFAALSPEGVHHVDGVPQQMYDETFHLFNSLISPWHQWLDTEKYDRHVDAVEALRPHTVLTAHGPVLTGTAIHDAFDRVRTLAGQPIAPRPGQEALDEMLATIASAAEAEDPAA